jgi:hypothetical protein
MIQRNIVPSSSGTSSPRRMEFLDCLALKKEALLTQQHTVTPPKTCMFHLCWQLSLQVDDVHINHIVPSCVKFWIPLTPCSEPTEHNSYNLNTIEGTHFIYYVVTGTLHILIPNHNFWVHHVPLYCIIFMPPLQWWGVRMSNHTLHRN